MSYIACTWKFGCFHYVSCVCFWLFNLHLLCFIFHHCWCEWKGTWSNNIEGIWDNNVVIFSFVKFYPISFVFFFSFVNYITRCIRNIQKPFKKPSVIWDESIKKCSTLKVKPNIGSSYKGFKTQTYLPSLSLCIFPILSLCLSTYLPRYIDLLI